ncbi:hypothetical protein IKG20_01035 [Candidatus Saccharibacteria bacterium]|nr:hypothetical protein [Candidatus Saccharibacteria bacterium]
MNNSGESVGRHVKTDENGDAVELESPEGYEAKHVAESDPWGEDYRKSVPEFAGDKKDRSIADIMSESLDGPISDGKAESEPTEGTQTPEELADPNLLSENELATIHEIISELPEHIRPIATNLANSKSAEEVLEELNSLQQYLLDTTEMALSSVSSPEKSNFAEYQNEYIGDSNHRIESSRDCLDDLRKEAALNIEDPIDEKVTMREIQSIDDDLRKVYSIINSKRS